MRELYASELHGTEEGGNARAVPLVRDWAERHRQTQVDRLSAKVETEEAGDGSLLVVVHQGGGDSLIWRSEVALGPPTDPLFATVRVRLGAASRGVVAPIDYEFGVPAIVRTLLREITVQDASHRVQPVAVELGASSIPELVDWLGSPDRRLPVVIASRTREYGALLLNEQTLARELAGMAHVRVLSGGQASWALTEAVGQPLSLWDGAVRIYFPGFSLTDEPRRHRVWFPDRVDETLVRQLRSWLGTLSSAQTGPHPVYERLRQDRLERLQQGTGSDSETIDMLWEEVGNLEIILKQKDDDLEDLASRQASLQSDYEAKLAECDGLRRNFNDIATQYSLAQRTTSQADTSDGAVLSVGDAIDDVQQLMMSRYYRERVAITEKALAEGRAFSNYNHPEELLRAVHAVLEAGALAFDGRLGEPPMTFFNRQGFGYGTLPQPHLKVDEHTSPDQCLRIYWEVDSQTGRWTITSIGLHQ